MTASTNEAVDFRLLINRRQITHGTRHCLFPRMYVKSGCSGYVCMPENAGYGRYVDTVLDRPCCKGVTDRVKSQMLQTEFFQNPLKMMLKIVGIQHISVTAEKDKIIFLRLMKY